MHLGICVLRMMVRYIGDPIHLPFVLTLSESIIRMQYKLCTQCVEIVDSNEDTCAKCHTLLRTIALPLHTSSMSHSSESQNPARTDKVIAIATGEAHALALTASGKVIAWGENEYGQATVPIGLGRVKEITAGWGRSLAIA